MKAFVSVLRCGGAPPRHKPFSAAWRQASFGCTRRVTTLPKSVRDLKEVARSLIPRKLDSASSNQAIAADAWRAPNTPTRSFFLSNSTRCFSRDGIESPDSDLVPLKRHNDNARPDCAPVRWRFGTNSGLPSIATLVMTVLNKDHLDWK
jgi:hypothetical protein